MIEKLPSLRSIRNPNHPGVSEAVNESFSEAAEVCLFRHHDPPEIIFSIKHSDNNFTRSLDWNKPSDIAQRAWNNQDDATRDGAYIVSLGITEKELGLVALSRAETRTGADYYIGDPKSDDLEDAFRLEVSGVDSGNLSQIKQRYKLKCKQALLGNSFLPAYACVVGFKMAVAILGLVEEKKC